MNKLDKHTMFLIANWNSTETLVATSPEEEPRKWWDIFRLGADSRKSLDNIVRYMVEAIDDLVILDLKNSKSGDIRVCVTQLYDAIVTLPFWALLVKSLIRDVVLNTMVPILVDFLKQKYTKAKESLKGLDDAYPNKDGEQQQQ